jgi:hypothetical protein
MPGTTREPWGIVDPDDIQFFDGVPAQEMYTPIETIGDVLRIAAAEALDLVKEYPVRSAIAAGALALGAVKLRGMAVDH